MENGKMENGFSVVDPLVEMGCRTSPKTLRLECRDY